MRLAPALAILLILVGCGSGDQTSQEEIDTRQSVLDWAIVSGQLVRAEDGEGLLELCGSITSAIEQWGGLDVESDTRDRYRTPSMEALFSAMKRLSGSVCILSDVFRLESERSRLVEEVTRFGVVERCATQIARDNEITDPEVLDTCVFG